VEWDPAQYLTWGGERARPFFDLVGRVGAERPALVVDLGCGPGTLTLTLADRWPDATVIGLDTSESMIDAAKPLERPGLSFGLGDVSIWQPSQPVDVIVSNAVLQWVPGHLDLLPALVAKLAQGGWLAFQVPGNFESASHTAIADLRSSARWRDQVGEGAVRGLAVSTPSAYLERLASTGCAVDVWETTYLHVLDGEDAVLEWVKGTALRPVLSTLSAEDASAFLGELAPVLRAAYPRSAYGTVLPFRRIFAVAHRPA
jgi:trans-aconitate 2-methyltransferase